ALFTRVQEEYRKGIPYRFGVGTEVHSNHDQKLILGSIQYDNADSVNQKMEELYAGFATSDWKSNVSFRTNALLKLADLMLIKRDFLSVHIMYESGKTLSESYADVDEAI